MIGSEMMYVTLYAAFKAKRNKWVCHSIFFPNLWENMLSIVKELLKDLLQQNKSCKLF